MASPRHSMQRAPSSAPRSRKDLSVNAATAQESYASSSASLYHPAHAHAPPMDTTHAQHSPSYARRTDSPPASAYFSRWSGADEPMASPDAPAHFAYSTTLRRHAHHTLEDLNISGVVREVREEGAASLWSKVQSALGGRPSYEPLATSEAPSAAVKVEPKDTPSSVFAHYSVADTVSHFHSSATSGLPSSSVPSILARVGYNEFTVSSPEPLLLKFAKTIYESPLILLLCGSAVISGVMGNIDDAVSITVAVLIVLTVGFVQEHRSEKSLEALNKLVPHHCHVTRDGQALHLLANELVPGDLVTFGVGDRVPADVRLTEAVDLEIDESSLTGETTARRKSAEACAPGLALAERTCVGYMGTLVRNGRGAGIVIATGTTTEFGVIFSMMQDVEEKRTPLQLSMDELAKKLSIISFGIIGVIVLIGVLQQRQWLDMFTIGVSLAVAAIPEGLPIVTTVTLALGVLRMAKRKAIVKKLHSVEALGSVSVICSDKTGTLTQNEQTVIELYAVDEVLAIEPHQQHQGARISAAMSKTLEIGGLCNNAKRNEEGAYVGQATDVALLNVLGQFEMGDARQAFTCTAERPFSSETKTMAVSGFHASSPRETFYIKGAVDAILERCRFYHVAEDSTPVLDANMRAAVLAKAQATATRGLRVLAMAYGYGSAADDSSHPNGLSAPAASRAPSPSAGAGDVKHGLVFAGFQAMLDPPRKGVADAVGLLQAGGVQVVMITGDAEQTARAIARELGLRVGAAQQAYPPDARGSGSGCLTGAAIDRMSAEQLREVVGGVSVFARTTPRHKMRIVEAFQSRGAVVAMTGDGVNDAPALKMADIGISMGKSGTDVAKEAADMILVDDNFSTILPAVEEGKSIFHNIQNFLSFQLSTAAAALTLITLSTMFGLSNPLNAMQILFINILMDGPPSQSLGVDPVDPAVMRKPPRRKNEPIISRRLLYRVLFSASIIVVGTLFIYAYALSDDHMSRREQTMTFTCFVFLDLVSALQNRGLGCAFTQNRMLLTTVSISFVSQLALVYVPFMQAIFQTEGLESDDLFTLLGLAGVSFTLHELRRRYERNLEKDGTWASVVEEMA